LWFVQNTDGTLPARIAGDPTLIRMLTQYYRIRLLPVIHLLMNSDIPSDWLVRVARENNLDGFILSMSQMPDNEWMARMRKELEVAPLEVLAMSTDDKTGVTSLREISLGYGILPAIDKIWTTRIRPVSGSDGLRIKAREEETQDGPIIWAIDAAAMPSPTTNAMDRAINTMEPRPTRWSIRLMRWKHTTNAVERMTNTVERMTNTVEHMTNTVEHMTNTVEHMTNAVERTAYAVEHITNAVETQK